MQHTPRTLTAIAMASLLAAFAAQANKGAEYKTHHPKTEHKNHFLTGGATYLEPSFHGIDYASTTFQAPSSSPVVDAENTQPEFDWGYFIQGGYRISHHYDVQASWAQFNSRLTDSISLAGDSVNSLLLYTSNRSELTPIGDGDVGTAQSKQNINYSVFDANLGQYHDITEMLRARIFAGIRYAQVVLDVDNVYTVNANSYVEDYDSSFNGVGPELGLDLEYKIWHTVGVVGHFAGAFLVGQQETESSVFYATGTAIIEVEADTTTRIVPALDAKLGLNWNVPYAYEKTNFGIEAGYQVAYYWNAIDQVQYPDLTAAAKVVHNYSNYGNMGPYLNLTAMF